MNRLTLLLLLLYCFAWQTAADAIDLIWTDSSTRQILRTTVGSVTPSVVLFDNNDYPGSPATVFPTGVALDNDFVYWADIVTQQVLRGAIDGSGSPTVLFDMADYPNSPGSIGPEDLAVDGGFLYWADPVTGQILRGAIDGSGSVTELYSKPDYPDSPTVTFPFGVDVQGDSIYWSDPDSNQILRGSIDGTAAVVALFDGSDFVDPNESLPVGIDVVGDNIYWTAGGVSFTSGKVLQGSADGVGSPSLLFDIDDYPGSPSGAQTFAVAVDRGIVYWTDVATQEILRGSSDGSGSAISVVTTPQPYLMEVVKSLAGDFDGDIDVDGADFLIWQRNFGQSVPPQEDSNGDGIANGADLAAWEATYGQSLVTPVTAAAAVPEPGSAVLMLVAMGFIYHREHRVCGQRTFVFSVLNCLFSRKF